MKTTNLMAKEYAIAMGAKPNKCLNQTYDGFTEGAHRGQQFIPVEEEKPPYGEDILVQSNAGSIYFGKMYEGTNGNPDYLQPDLAGSEWRLKIQQIKSWRPIFYK